MHAERIDALVTFAGCDKSLPGMLMAAARLNVPSVFLYGGSILPGHHKGQALDIVSVFEAVGATPPARIDDEGLGAIERNACPTEGACAGMFTANTMASVAEALGDVAARVGLRPAVDRRRDDSPTPRARRWSTCSRPASVPARSSPRRRSRTPSPSSWPWAAPPTPCSTSWRSPRGRVDLALDDFNRVAARVPHIADMKPPASTT